MFVIIMSCDYGALHDYLISHQLHFCSHSSDECRNKIPLWFLSVFVYFSNLQLFKVLQRSIRSTCKSVCKNTVRTEGKASNMVCTIDLHIIFISGIHHHHFSDSVSSSKYHPLTIISMTYCSHPCYEIDICQNTESIRKL